MLEAREIKKSFGDTEVLHGISLAIEPGTITAVIGPSGSGKTTLLRAMSLLDPPTSGAVSIDGTTYAFGPGLSLPEEPPWPTVTVVFQQLFLWPHMTLRRNITLPMIKNGMPASNGRLDELISLFEMEDFIDRYPNEVSIGQRQRAAIARALVLNPKYILLDEITSALDIEQVGKVLAHLRSLRDRGIAIMVVTHLMRFARRAADQVLFMDDGDLVEIGDASVLDDPKHPRVRKFLSMLEEAH